MSRGTATVSYRSSPTSRRRRRTREEVDALREHIYDVAEADHPVSIRQVFYRLVSLGVIEKSEGEYSATVGRLCAEMRKAGELPWSWVADNTRWMRKPHTFDSVEDALSETARTYRRSLWTKGDYVEIWLEKEALSGVLFPVTAAWDVPLMVTRGYPSLTFLHAAAETFPTDRRTFIYYFGDHDPSGVDIARHTEQQLLEFYTRSLLDRIAATTPAVEDQVPRAMASGLVFRRVAVTPEQIAELDLPTRPTKRTDTRAKGWNGGSVEVDAIPPATLRSLCEEVIVSHVDERELAVLREAEAREREVLRGLAAARGVR